MTLVTVEASQIMSEIDNATLVESALEMQPLEQETAPAAEPVIESAASNTVSNQEAMTALVLGRVKKQSKQIENVTRIVSQLPPQVRNLEKRQSRQAKQLSLQIRALQNQVKQIQKRVSRIKTASTRVTSKKSTRKATKKTRRR